MLRADEVVTHSPRFFERYFDDSFDARRRDDLLNDDSLIAADHRLDRFTNLADVNSEVPQHLIGNSFAFAHQAEEQMLSADVAVMRALGLFLGKRQHLLGPLAESLKGVHEGSQFTPRV